MNLIVDELSQEEKNVENVLKVDQLPKKPNMAATWEGR